MNEEQGRLGDFLRKLKGFKAEGLNTTTEPRSADKYSEKESMAAEEAHKIKSAFCTPELSAIFFRIVSDFFSKLPEEFQRDETKRRYLVSSIIVGMSQLPTDGGDEFIDFPGEYSVLKYLKEKAVNYDIYSNMDDPDPEDDFDRN